MRAQYEYVTEKWIKNRTPNSHKVKEAKYFEYKDGNKYYVDGKYVILDYSEKEKEVAEWLKETFGGEIYMLPRINKPEGIKTADYLWNGEYWDLKEINNNGKNVIDNRVNGYKNQTNNFIFDISNNILSDLDIIKQIEKVYKSPTRNWINKIILIRNKKLIKIYQRKKD